LSVDLSSTALVISDRSRQTSELLSYLTEMDVLPGGCTSLCMQFSTASNILSDSCVFWFPEWTLRLDLSSPLDSVFRLRMVVMIFQGFEFC
jgi:hypothetical protein